MSASNLIVENSNPNQISSRFYKPELDALRFFAFLSVFGYHACILTPGLDSVGFVFAYSGAFGMCLFFVLSAYLISELLLREKAKTGTVHIKAFYMRRILRIWPLYFAFLIFCFFLGEVHRPWRLSPGLIFSFLGLAGNWYLIHVNVVGPVMPLWTISLEEQFYLAWPSLAKYRSRRALLWLSIGLVPFSWITIFVLTRMGWNCYQIWWNSLTQFQYFGVGALLALLFQKRQPNWPLLARLAIFSLGLGCWVAASYLTQLNLLVIRPGTSLVLSYLAAAIGCGLLFVSVLGSSNRRWPKPLLYLGKISYGLYVFHFLCLLIAQRLFAALGARFQIVEQQSVPFSFIKTLLALVLTIAFAGLSYGYLEKPFLGFKERFAFVKSRRA